MLTTKQIQSFFDTIHTGKDFPYIAAKLKTIGINGYTYLVSSGDSAFYNKQDEIRFLPGRGIARNITPQADPARFSHILRTHQMGKIDFTLFSQQAADAGINLWVVDLIRMNVSYFSLNGYLLHEETIPVVPFPV
ncbi:DUF1398 domain-containing protein [Buttiauxella sp. B2]|uniref:DUF1398 domain-containing protein n=1 Tax=Buttiauxella sp. B2 TaxID=2587812 RepID=UPI001124296C|nr:DUF1398 family protein [Buttiauxella sp. B2]TNV21331.1 DUF1398 domain-containing protein [Buttiauxella sp. B2]